MPVQPGQLLRRRLLETEAVYRVVAEEDEELVEVEVVSAPGLAPGHRLRFTATAVEEMEAVDRDPARVRPSGSD